MKKGPYNILFVCTGNSARSIMAEAICNALGQGRFQAYSAGTRPSGKLHPMAIETLAQLGISSAGYRSKSWNEFAEPDAPPLDFIFTVCDNASREKCPLWPGLPVTAHWGVIDPGDVEGGDDDRRAAFLDRAKTFKRRIELLLSLPIDDMDAVSLQRALHDIGTR